MRLGIVFLREPEVVQALRNNVADLQHRLNRTRFHMARVDAKREKLARQLKLDRIYIERVKVAAYAVLKESGDEDETAGKAMLRAALRSQVDPDKEQAAA